MSTRDEDRTSNMDDRPWNHPIGNQLGRDGRTVDEEQ
eukprot:CAMPEP_0197434238 /NCGR_PEP_ID=MMETSP1175-20131217/1989_1 /TAXON_ID=1003142 /ORGANISM="Triceratium dubium, Strain CCMP147" /LENGTH=36 /DNA_ID= /DNA_START= /DNA_END= /DNA_ORIENTATION=